MEVALKIKSTEKILVFGSQEVKINYLNLSPLAQRQLDRLIRKLQLERNQLVGSHPKRYEIKIKQLLKSEIQKLNKK